MYALVNWIIIDSCNGLVPVQHQAIIWTNADFVVTGSTGANFV